MKTFFTLLVAASLPVFTACDKEAIAPQPMALKAPTVVSISDCPYPLYEQAVAETKLAYQQLANTYCDTIWVDITCCLNGQETYALVFVAPNDPKCGHQIDATYK